MKKREIMSIALKVLGVFAFINGLSMTQFPFMFIPQVGMTRQPMTMSLWISLACMFIPVVLLLVAGVILVTRGDRWAAKWFPSENTSSTTQSAITAQELQAMAFSVLGMYLILTALPGLAATGVNMFTESMIKSSDAAGSVTLRPWRTSISGTVQAILGVLLFLRARGMAKLSRSA